MLVLSIVKRAVLAIIAMRCIGIVSDLAYLYHFLAFVGVACAPVLSAKYFMPYILSPSRFYSDWIGRGPGMTGTWLPPSWLLQTSVKHVTMLVWIFYVSKTILKLLALKKCGKDNSMADSFYARQLTWKAYGMYWITQIPIVKAITFLFPMSLPFNKYLMSGIPMACLYIIFLVKGCLPPVYQIACL